MLSVNLLQFCAFFFWCVLNMHSILLKLLTYLAYSQFVLKIFQVWIYHCVIFFHKPIWNNNALNCVCNFSICTNIWRTKKKFVTHFDWEKKNWWITPYMGFSQDGYIHIIRNFVSNIRYYCVFPFQSLSRCFALAHFWTLEE